MSKIGFCKTEPPTKIVVFASKIQSVHLLHLVWSKIHWEEQRLGHLGFQFSDFQLKSFVDPKPVEL